MALDTMKDLFLYQLVGMRDGERTTCVMLGGLLGNRVRNSALQSTLREQSQECESQVRNIDSCLQTIEVSMPGPRFATLEGIRLEFETFLGLDPAAEVRDMFAIDTAAQILRAIVARYTSLVNGATILGEEHCAQTLRINLARKEAGVRRIEEIRQELSRPHLSTA